MKTNRSGFVVIWIIAGLVALLGGVYVVKPSLLPGASKRADQSTKTTQQLVAAEDVQNSTAAASVVKIGEANSEAPESPQKKFISSEVPLALSRMRPPNPQELVNAERRKTAIVEGRLDEARKLYEDAAKKSESLQGKLDASIHAKNASDLALEKSAAAEHARTMQLIGAGAIALLVGAAWLWAKIHSIGPDTAGKILHEIKSGVDPVQAFDTFTHTRLQSLISKARKLAAP